jgi:hypothetical protein
MLPGLGESDHYMIHLLPTYKQKFKAEKPVKKTVLKWTDDALETLKGCFECTEWEILCDKDRPLEENIDVLSSYISFCVDSIVPKKEVTCYPNNKAWVTGPLKVILNRKKVALAKKDKDDLKQVKGELKVAIRACKSNYKDKVERLFKSNNSKQAWAGLSHIAGNKQNKRMLVVDNDEDFANELNIFYSRFNTRDESDELSNLTDGLRKELHLHQCPSVTVEEVRKCFRKQKCGKAPGPDKISGIILRECGDQIAPICATLFNRSLRLAYVPKKWKVSILVPLPKSVLPEVKNDLRPVALTDLIMKNFEKLFGRVLSPEVKEFRDKLQFAYKDSSGVEDAVCTFIHEVSSHLDGPNTAVRALYIDFSSAFNTISPVTMANKLINMEVNPYLTLWITSFLTDRSQYVRFNSATSESLTMNTGAPQGCVLSPILFTLYTSDCRAQDNRCKIVNTQMIL